MNFVFHFLDVNHIFQRKKTLLVEYSNLGKVNSIVDRRTGEYDKSLNSEQKKLKRLARVRKVSMRHICFGLLQLFPKNCKTYSTVSYFSYLNAV